MHYFDEFTCYCILLILPAIAILNTDFPGAKIVNFSMIIKASLYYLVKEYM